jgi:hypothetical protein
MQIQIIETQYVKNVTAVLFENGTYDGSEPISGAVEIFDEDLSINGSNISTFVSFVNSDGLAIEEITIDVTQGAYMVVIGFEGEVITKLGGWAEALYSS